MLKMYLFISFIILCKLFSKEYQYQKYDIIDDSFLHNRREAFELIVSRQKVLESSLVFNLGAKK